MLSTPATCRLAFQSTLSVRRATVAPVVHHVGLRISIHALREESDSRMPLWHDLRQISIHALREESDPTLMAAGRPSPISIHALREESDSCFCVCGANAGYFNPRSP